MNTCKRCAIGALHAGRADYNSSPLKGMTICGRCHTGTTRLIQRHLCVSCANRQYEYLKGRNAKGTKPVKLPPLDQRSITYLTGGAVKTRTIAHTVDMTELVVAVIRHEQLRVTFGYGAPAAMETGWPDDEFDRSIPNDVDAVLADIQDVPYSAHEPAAAPLAASVLADVAVPLPAALDVVHEEPAADVESDQLQALRDALERDDRDVPVSMPTMWRRATKKLCQKARRQVRVSNVTVSLLRNVGALPAPVPLIVPEPTPRPFYSANLFAD